MRENRKGNGGDGFGVSVRGMKESGKGMRGDEADLVAGRRGYLGNMGGGLCYRAL
jgi:hypothetical protein